MNDLAVAIPKGLFREVDDRPRGYRCLEHAMHLSGSGKAVRVRYYGWEIWLPVKDVAIKWPSYEMFGNGWAIDSAKEHPSAKQVD